MSIPIGVSNSGSAILGDVLTFFAIILIGVILSRVALEICGAMLCCCTKKSARAANGMATGTVIFGALVWATTRIFDTSKWAFNWRWYAQGLDNFINNHLWGETRLLHLIGLDSTSVARVLWITLGALLFIALLRIGYILIRSVWCCGDYCADVVTSTILWSGALLVLLWYVGPVYVLSVFWSPIDR